MLSNYKWYNTCLEASMRICLAFYRTVAFSLLLITFITAAQVWLSGSAYFIFRVFWVKVFTGIIIVTFVAIFRSGQFIFFHNLGYTRTRLLAYVFILDFSIWLLTMILVANLL